MVMGRNDYGPKWSWAEMVMGRNDPESILVVLCKGVFSVVSHSPFKIVCPGVTDLFHMYFCQLYPKNQRTYGPLNAHLLSGPRKSTKHKKPRKNKIKK